MRAIVIFFLGAFFIFTVPIAIFFATVLYGGISSPIIKQELSQAHIYSTLTDELKKMLKADENKDDSSAFALEIVQERVTPLYLQDKTEVLIDDIADWLVADASAPTISFKEIKEDIVAKNPQLITDIETSLEELKKQQQEMAAAASGAESASAEDLAAMTAQLDSINSLIQSDFTFPIGERISVIKNTYTIIKIALPVLIVLLLACLGGIIFLNQSTSSRLRSLGIVLSIAAVYGFLLTLSNTFILTITNSILLEQDNTIILALSPMVHRLMQVFIDQYKHYQTTVSIIFVAVAVVCLILSFVLKPQTQVAKVKVKTKK